MVRRLLRGARSFVIKLLSIDLRVASYVLFGPPKPPRIVYVSVLIGVIGLLSAVIQNPTGATALVLLVLALLLVSAYTLAQAPPFRWHILRYNMNIRYEDDSDSCIQYADTFHMRGLTKLATTLRYPITNYTGELTILEVKQDAEDLSSKQESQGGPGYYLTGRARGLATVAIDLRRPIRFGEDTAISIRWRLDGAAEDHHVFTVQTFVDRISFNVCFFRTRYPVKVECFDEFGVRQTSLDFYQQKRAEGDHICESWEPEQVEFMHKYMMRWTFPTRPSAS